MAFHDVRFPTRDEWGSSGGPGNSTAVFTMDSGQERRMPRWTAHRHLFDVAAQVKEYNLLAEVKAFYLARGGIQHSFRYKDWLDYNTTVLGHDWEGENSPATDEDQTIGVGDGTTTTFQLVKRYTDEEEAATYVRSLTKIVEGTVVISIDGTPTASGWSVNLLTGIVTFDVAPAEAEVIKAGCEFDVEVRFGDGVDEFFATTASNFGSGEIANLPLVEIMGGELVNEDVFRGGAKQLTLAGNVTIDMSSVVWTLLPTVVSPKATLPALSGLPKGGPLFVLINIGGSASVDVRDSADVALDALVTGGIMELYHGVDAAGASKWYFTQVLMP